MDRNEVMEVTIFFHEGLSLTMRKMGFVVKPARIDPEIVHPFKEQRLKHLLWMIEESQRLVRDNKIEKAMRWLVFVQGSLWAFNIITIAESTDVNRGDFSKY